MNKQHVSDTLAILMATGLKNCPVIKNQTIMDGIVGMWYRQFKDYTDEQMTAAIDAHCKLSKWFPAPADLLEYMIPVNPTYQITASEGWDEAFKALGSYGRENGEAGLASLSPVVRRVVKGFGWRNLCNQKIDDFFMAKWNKIYNETKDQEETADERDPERANQRLIGESVLQISSNTLQPKREQPKKVESLSPEENQKRIRALIKGLGE